MNKENFRVLKEINSLLTKCQILEAQIESENSRLDKIERQIKLKKDQMNLLTEQSKSHKQNLSQKEAELFKVEKQNEAATTNMNRAITEKELNAAQDQLNKSAELIERLNEEILNLMEKDEEFDDQIKEISQFLTGIEEGKSEIKEDIKTNTDPMKKELEGYRSRIENLFGEIPSPHDQAFKNLVAKNLPKGPITRLNQQNYCELCGTQISATKVKAVEEQLQYSACSGCTRVIIPESSQYL